MGPLPISGNGEWPHFQETGTGLEGAGKTRFAETIPAYRVQAFMPRRTRHGWLVALLASLCLAPCALASNVVQTEQVRAELVAHAPEGLAPGNTVWLGLALEHIPHWHTYWKNPGDSGLPTTMTWQLPPGAAAGDIDWPAPSRLPLGPLLNF